MFSQRQRQRHPKHFNRNVEATTSYYWWMSFEYANNFEQAKAKTKDCVIACRNSIRSHSKIRWDYFVSRAKGKSRILNINVHEWIKNYSIPYMRCSLFTKHHSLTHTHKRNEMKTKIFAQLKQNTNNELRYYSLFSGNWHNIFLFFCYYFSSFSHHHCALLWLRAKHNEWCAFHLDFVEYCHFDYFNFRHFFSSLFLPLYLTLRLPLH